ncbi:MAG: zinc ribbon domain-containing protein [Phycisphaerae bacterium]
MPIYEYRCTTCEHRFEELVRANEKRPAACPKCSSQATERLLSVFAARSVDRPEAPATGGCTRCGDPNGPCQW